MARNTSLLLTLMAAALGCTAPPSSSVDATERKLVVKEVQERLDQYAAAVMRKDLNAILSFWSDAEEFVFAGDGSVLGGFAEWAALAKQDNDQTERWIHWKWNDVHILPLSRDAASVTLEFDYEKVLVQGDAVRGYGSWTYVLKRTDAGWQVFHGNGHHIAR